MRLSITIENVTLSKTIENVTLSKTIENVTLSKTIDSITAKNVEFLMPFVLIGDKLILHLTILLGIIVLSTKSSLTNMNNLILLFCLKSF